MDLINLGKEPVSLDKPTGIDVRYELEFEQLQAEIDKLASPSAASGVDWKNVSNIAAAILADKSKDLLVASYLAVAQIHLHQMDGFETGLKVLHDLLNLYWDKLFPPKKRMRGRLGALEWWLGKTETALAKMETIPQTSEKIVKYQSIINQMGEILNRNMPDAPLLRPILRQIEKFPVADEEKKEDEVPVNNENPEPPPKTEIKQVEPVQAAQAAKQPEPKSVKSEPDAIENEKVGDVRSAQKALDTYRLKFRQISEILTELDPANLLAYRCRRIGTWLTIENPPPETDSKTRIASPDNQAINTIKKLKENQNWPALLKTSERYLTQYIFWLDLNRYSAEAAAMSGDKYQIINEVICQETAFFLQRLAGLENLTFSDGKPFANDATRQWLKIIGAGNSGFTADSTIISGNALRGDFNKKMEKVIQKAHKLAGKKKLVEAVALLHGKMQTSFSQREVLLWRIAICRIILEAKKASMALPHLEEIMSAIEIHGLELWDPDLALEGLELVWNGYRAHPDKEIKKSADIILNRIGKLDPAQALCLNG